ncbi:MAG TPA: coproporphyrinogen dehydrogenase HemZ, partial [Oscillospiraceae bacterium]|nr:coproporphyrinogen dehydrogenase HemZ [Oscillospiraceae bacterium]
MNLIIDNHPYHYEMEALCRMFLRGEELKILETAAAPAGDFLYTGLNGGKVSVRANYKGKAAEQTADAGADAERSMARAVYSVMSTLTGLRPKWGVLTGIRPVKLAMELADEGKTPKEIRHILSTDRLISDEKISLMIETMLHEREIRQSSRPESVSLYISIPFCPTRCSYCSFISHSIEKAAKLIPPYVELLCKELTGIAELIEELGLRLETVYMGGGTPSVLSAEQLDAVLGTVESSFDMSTVRELTVEAGRPDTITPEKLEAMKNH